MQSNFTFVINPPADGSTRSKESVNSQARSHASRVSHQRRRNRRNPTETHHNDDYNAAKLPLRKSRLHASRLSPNTHHGTELSRSPTLTPNSSTATEDTASTNDDDERDDMLLSIEEAKRTTEWLQMFGVRPPIQALTLEVDSVCHGFWQITAASMALFSKLWKVQTPYNHSWLELFANEAFARVGALYVKYDHGKLVDPHGRNPERYLSNKVETLKFIRRRVAESEGILDEVTVMAIVWLAFADENRHDDPKKYWKLGSQLLAKSYKSPLIQDKAQSEHLRLTLNRFKSYIDHPAMTSLVVAENGGHQRLPMSPSTCRRPLQYSPELLPRFPTGITALFEEETIGSTTLACVERFLSFTSTTPDGNTYLSVPAYFDTEIPGPNSFIHAWNIYNSTSSTVPGEPSIELLLPVAIIMYSGRISGPLGLVNGQIRGCRAHVTVGLPCCRLQRSVAEENALFWMFVVAIESWRTGVGDLHQQGIQLRDTMFKRFPWSSDRDVAVPVLKRFFHDDDLLRNYGRLDKAIVALARS